MADKEGAQALVPQGAHYPPALQNPLPPQNPSTGSTTSTLYKTYATIELVPL